MTCTEEDCFFASSWAARDTCTAVPTVSFILLSTLFSVITITVSFILFRTLLATLTKYFNLSVSTCTVGFCTSVLAVLSTVRSICFFASCWAASDTRAAVPTLFSILLISSPWSVGTVESGESVGTVETVETSSILSAFAFNSFCTAKTTLTALSILSVLNLVELLSLGGSGNELGSIPIDV